MKIMISYLKTHFSLGTDLVIRMPQLIFSLFLIPCGRRHSTESLEILAPSGDGLERQHIPTALRLFVCPASAPTPTSITSLYYKNQNTTGFLSLLLSFFCSFCLAFFLAFFLAFWRGGPDLGCYPYGPGFYPLGEADRVADVTPPGVPCLAAAVSVFKFENV